MADLSAFLLARIGEDEAVAQAAIARNGSMWTTETLNHNGARITGGTELGNPRAYNGDTELWSDEGTLGMYEETAAHVVRWHPARVLAECDAKRRIVEHEAPGPRSTSDSALQWTYTSPALAILALPYADHPDYREEWRP